MKAADDGDHYRLAFDKPGTWSQKYNLVWDRILGLNVFPPEAAQQEIAYYKKVMQPYGVPLDSRTKLTKTDWSLWSATLADNQADFEALVSPIYDYLDQTTARDPLADSYETDNVKSGGMHARPVVGGLFIKMLADRDDVEEMGAPRPHEGRRLGAAADARRRSRKWSRPPSRQPVTVALHLREARGGLDQAGLRRRRLEGRPRRVRHQHHARDEVIGTMWKTDDIWLRREFTMPEGEFPISSSWSTTTRTWRSTSTASWPPRGRLHQRLRADGDP